MAGVRTALFFAIAAAVVAVIPWGLQQPLRFEFVTTQAGLHVMRNEVTVADWVQCVEERGCKHTPKTGLEVGQNNFPVTDVNWFDVNEFVTWASARSGLELRLPTLDEWRALSEIVPKPKRLLFTDPRLAWAADYGNDEKIDPVLRPSGGFGTTLRGIADVKGNVWEWTSTCASIGFEGKNANRCPAYQVAGEHDAVISIFVRDPALGGCSSGVPPAHLGFRLVAVQQVGR